MKINEVGHSRNRPRYNKIKDAACALKVMTQEEIKAIIRQEMPEILQDREMRDYYKRFSVT